MIDTLRSEWIKVRTVRVHIVLLIIAVAIPLIVTSLATLLVGNPRDDLAPTDLADLIGVYSVPSMMLLGVVASLSISSEFGHGTIRPTFAATPVRSRVFVAKLAVNAAVALVLATIIVGLCFLVGRTILSARDTKVSLSLDDGSVGALLGVIALCVLLTFFGFAVALLIRNSAAAVTIMLVWPLVAESIIAGLLSVAKVDDAFKWMPYQAAISMVVTAPGDDVLGRPLGGAYFAACRVRLSPLAGRWRRLATRELQPSSKPSPFELSAISAATVSVESSVASPDATSSVVQSPPTSTPSTVAIPVAGAASSRSTSASALIGMTSGSGGAVGAGGNVPSGGSWAWAGWAAARPVRRDRRGPAGSADPAVRAQGCVDRYRARPLRRHGRGRCRCGCGTDRCATSVRSRRVRGKSSHGSHR
jgi:ABC-2 type transport system permease protein